MKDTAVLLIDCPDRKGLIARVSGLLYERGANILHADQHQDHELGLFFMRVEWTLNSGIQESAGTEESAGATAEAWDKFDLDGFKAAFAPLANELEMHWSLVVTDRRPRVALFCSQY